MVVESVRGRATDWMRGKRFLPSPDKLRELGKNNTPKNLTFSKESPCTVTITIYQPTNRRMDAPNWYPTIKALIDGLTDGGLWTDDNNEVIQSITFKFGGLSGSNKYKIEISVINT